MAFLTKKQLIAIHAKTNLPNDKIEKLDEIWLRLDVPQRSLVLDKVHKKEDGIQQEARVPLDRLNPVLIKKLAKFYDKRL